jgi:hypothetical protein
MIRNTFELKKVDEVLIKLKTDFEKNPISKVSNNVYVTPLFAGLHPEYYVEKKIITQQNVSVKKHTLLDDLMNRR